MSRSVGSNPTVSAKAKILPIFIGRIFALYFSFFSIHSSILLFPFSNSCFMLHIPSIRGTIVKVSSKSILT